MKNILPNVVNIQFNFIQISSTMPCGIFSLVFASFQCLGGKLSFKLASTHL